MKSEANIVTRTPMSSRQLVVLERIEWCLDTALESVKDGDLDKAKRAVLMAQGLSNDLKKI